MSEESLETFHNTKVTLNQLKFLLFFFLDSESLPRELEDLIDSLGSFGHWQRVIFVLISLADIYGAFAMMLPVFSGATPKWRCNTFLDDDGNLRNASDLSNDTAFQCSLNLNNFNYTCASFSFDDEFTSIVSQVSVQRSYPLLQLVKYSSLHHVYADMALSTRHCRRTLVHLCLSSANHYNDKVFLNVIGSIPPQFTSSSVLPCTLMVGRYYYYICLFFSYSLLVKLSYVWHNVH